MRESSLLILISVGLFFGACGTDIPENRTYNMWEYMTPAYSIDVEYNEYKNGQKVDYFYETTKVFSDFVERVSGDDRTKLTPYENFIRVEEPNGDVVSVQRYVKIGDSDIFDSSANQKCKAEDFFHSIRIRGYEFFNTIKVSCINSDSSTTDLYYGYDEGIVAIDRNRDGTRTEIVKVDERRLQ
jgi:hypothetical protein